MTIEEKARRYDEAITKAKALYGQPLVDNTLLETIIPELKESDDERIKKCLLKYFENRGPNGVIWNKIGISRENVLAWLEKQGEQETDEWKEGNIIRHGGILALVIKGRRVMKSNGEIFTVQYPDEWVKAEPNEIEHFLDELEKQGKKPQGKTALEAINEVKDDNQNCVNPVDKVEPKFHEGDWITCKELNTAKIIDINDDRYKVEFFDGHRGIPYIDYIDRNFHLWTIQDAKDGDIISWDDSKCIALFKNIYDEDSFNSHGFVGHCTGVFESRLSYHDIEGAHPATKEQCDTLERAMTNAGYRWNKEELKLKKI